MVSTASSAKIKSKSKKARRQKLVYFAHPMPTYNTLAEKSAMKILMQNFSDSKIINPRYIDQTLESHEIMAVCLDYVKMSDYVVFISDEGVIGKGVYAEIKFAEKLGKKVYYLHMDSLHTNYKIKESDMDSWIEYAEVNII